MDFKIEENRTIDNVKALKWCIEDVSEDGTRDPNLSAFTLDELLDEIKFTLDGLLGKIKSGHKEDKDE